MKQRIFVGSSGEALEVCRAVQAELEGDFAVTVWDQDVFKPSAGALESLVATLDASDAGIFVLRPDDLKTSRGTAAEVARDNVVLELGMFFGRMGRERTFMLTPEGAAPTLPTDLWGLTTLEYNE